MSLLRRRAMMEKSGGDSVKEWRFIKKVEINESTEKFVVSSDENGDPFELEELLIYSDKNVTAASNSQLLLFLDDMETSTSANAFLTTSPKSILYKTEWCGVRLSQSLSATYPITQVALSNAAYRISTISNRYFKKIELKGQKSIETGTFYFYGR